MIDEIAELSSKRYFSTFVSSSGQVFVIQETIGVGIGRHAAWNNARSQFLPAVFVSKKGRQESLGRVFNPRTFERKVYQAHIDLNSKPFPFNEWVKTFREAPQLCMEGVPAYVEASLGAYRILLASATGRAN